MSKRRYVEELGGINIDFPDEMSEQMITEWIASEAMRRRSESIPAVVGGVVRGQAPMYLEPELPSQVGSTVRDWLAKRVTQPLVNVPTPDLYRKIGGQAEQLGSAISDFISQSTTPANIALMAAGARIPPGAQRAAGAGLAAMMGSEGVEQIKSGNVPKGIVDLALGSAAMIPAGAKLAADVAPAIPVARDIGQAAWEATKQTFDIGQPKIYDVGGGIGNLKRPGLTTEVPYGNGRSPLVVTALRSTKIPATDSLTVNAGALMSEAGIENALRQGTSFYANGPDMIGRWVGKFKSNPLVQRLYAPKDLDNFLGGMNETAKIFGDKYPTPVEGASPLRHSIDENFNPTMDCTTLCPRQDQYVTVIRNLERESGRLFDPTTRFKVGQIMWDAGEAPACFFCYGQTKRDLAEYSVDRVAQIFNASNALQKTGVRNKQAYMDAFGSWTAFDRKTGKPSMLFNLVKEYSGNPKAERLFADPVRLRDLIYAGEHPTHPTEVAIADQVGKIIQGGIHPNLVKGFAEYKDQLLRMDPRKIEALNAVAGLRMNSQTDFRVWHVLEISKFIAHGNLKGAMAHVYTRQPEFIEIFGDTGIKFNVSMEFAKNPDGTTMLDRDGQPVVNEMNTMPYSTLMEFRKRYPKNVGSMLVAFSDQDVRLGMRTPWVDMIIPYHKGTVSEEVNQLVKATDYTSMQHERWPKNIEKGTPITVKLSNGKTVTVRAKKSITRAQHFNDKKLYLELAEKCGFIPKFRDFIDEPGYMKAIIDVAREPSNQDIVDPSKINWEAAGRWLDKWIAEGALEARTTPETITPGLLPYVRARLTDEGLFTPSVPQRVGRSLRKSK